MLVYCVVYFIQLYDYIILIYVNVREENVKRLKKIVDE